MRVDRAIPSPSLHRTRPLPPRGHSLGTSRRRATAAACRTIKDRGKEYDFCGEDRSSTPWTPSKRSRLSGRLRRKTTLRVAIRQAFFCRESGLLGFWALLVCCLFFPRKKKRARVLSSPLNLRILHDPYRKSLQYKETECYHHYHHHCHCPLTLDNTFYNRRRRMNRKGNPGS